MRVLLITAAAEAEAFVREAFFPTDAAIGQAVDGEDALLEAGLFDHDLILLDLALPGRAALEVLRRLRRSGQAAPVILLAGGADAAERTRALDLGADDCVGPWVDPAELLARSRAVVRRAAGHAGPALSVGALTLDPASRAVALAGAPLRITGKEFALLELLALRRGRLVRRETIMDHLYGGPQEPVAKVIDIHVCRIRRKLAQAGPAVVMLRTVWGQGFMLCETGQAGAESARLAA